MRSSSALIITSPSRLSAIISSLHH
jgi:hypothetical protein